MSDKQNSVPRRIIEGYQPGGAPLDLSKLKPPKGDTAAQPPLATPPAQPPKPSGEGKSS